MRFLQSMRYLGRVHVYCLNQDFQDYASAPDWNNLGNPIIPVQTN